MKAKRFLNFLETVFLGDPERRYEKWFHKVSRSVTEKQYEGCVALPGFPDDQVQINTTSQAGRATLVEAYVFYRDCIRFFKEHSPLFHQRNKKLLDFGIGWGRVARFFLKDFKPKNLIGLDVDRELIDICNETFSHGTFMVCNPFPPTLLSDQSIDFIIGFSVFSHLSEDACRSWVEEFARVLKPGGVVALTTRAKWFLDYCESLQYSQAEGYSKTLSHLFEDFEDAKKRYARGEFLYKGVGGGGVLDGSFYGETFISEGYAKHAYSAHFEVTFFDAHETKTGLMTHPIIFLTKRM